MLQHTQQLFRLPEQLAADAGALVAGPRLGRFDKNGKPRPMPGHNSVFYISGALLLW